MQASTRQYNLGKIEKNKLVKGRSMHISIQI